MNKKKQEVITSPAISLPIDAKSGWDLARMWKMGNDGFAAHDAIVKAIAEGWTWIGYDDYGDDAYVPPVSPVPPR